MPSSLRIRKLFNALALAGAIIATVQLARHFTHSKLPTGPPTFPSKVVARGYMDTDLGDYFFLVNAKYQMCHVSQDTYLDVVVGEEATCEWKEKP